MLLPKGIKEAGLEDSHRARLSGHNPRLSRGSGPDRTGKFSSDIVREGKYHN